MSGMRMVFTNSHDILLYSTAWTPHSAGAYAGTCISLIVVALVLRCLFALKPVLEQKWRARAQSRRCALVRGKVTEAGKIEDGSDAKNGCLVTTHGVEPNVKVVYTNAREVIPFRLSVDVPRAAIVMISGLNRLAGRPRSLPGVVGPVGH